MGARISSPEAKAAEAEADRLPPSTLVTKNAQSCAFTPLHGFMTWCLFEHSHTLTLTSQSVSSPCFVKRLA
jgi:hypothetical protein